MRILEPSRIHKRLIIVEDAKNAGDIEVKYD